MADVAPDGCAGDFPKEDFGAITGGKPDCIDSSNAEVDSLQCLMITWKIGVEAL